MNCRLKPGRRLPAPGASRPDDGNCEAANDAVGVKSNRGRADASEIVDANGSSRQTEASHLSALWQIHHALESFQHLDLERGKHRLVEFSGLNQPKGGIAGFY